MGTEGTFEIIRKTIMTGYLMLPRPTRIIEIGAVVRCPDQTEILMNTTISDQLMSPEEIDVKILNDAEQMYRAGEK